MANILKCKMCGGDIEVSQDMTVGKCLFCGSTMTLPRIDSDKKARLFNRANEYRLNNEFDKAYDAYKTITEEDEQEAEAYWGMILSEYGVEYVEDPNAGKRIPTCHRTQVTNIQNTTNYKMAMQYADSERKFMYQDEAEEIDKLQRDILAVSSKEEGYDVFICYKESEENGARTQDSVLAQDIYNELNRNGIRAFFSRISLEDHLGENYEPYIYSALSSSKVMILVSTKREHCEAVWVKNEWARFIGFMNEDPAKIIIPVYKEMSPYEFPPELSKYQAQNMDKIGAVQDLTHAVGKLIERRNGIDTGSEIKKLIVDIREKEEKSRQNKKRFAKIAIVGGIIVLIVVMGVIGLITIHRKQEIKRINEEKEQEIKRINEEKEQEYQAAVSVMQRFPYNKTSLSKAIKMFVQLGDYKDSIALSEECKKQYCSSIYGKTIKFKTIRPVTINEDGTCLVNGKEMNWYFSSEDSSPIIHIKKDDEDLYTLSLTEKGENISLDDAVNGFHYSSKLE